MAALQRMDRCVHALSSKLYRSVLESLGIFGVNGRPSILGGTIIVPMEMPAGFV